MINDNSIQLPFALTTASTWDLNLQKHCRGSAGNPSAIQVELAGPKDGLFQVIIDDLLFVQERPMVKSVQAITFWKGNLENLPSARFDLPQGRRWHQQTLCSDP